MSWSDVCLHAWGNPGLRRLAAAAAVAVFVGVSPMPAWGDVPGAEKPRPAPDDQARPRVVLATNMGDIVLELDRKAAPLTVANFLAYVDAKHYDGTVFHRVIDNFMIQGGGLNEEMQEKAAKPPIKNESGNGLKNARGTIAMARTGEPDSATCQFFINVKDNDFLDGAAGRPGYAVFGKVVAGMDVVDKIKAVKTRAVGAMQDVPREPVVIKSAKRAVAEK